MNAALVILILIAVVNPARARWALPPREGRELTREVGSGALAVAMAAVTLALLATTIVDLFGVSNPSFRLGAGAVMLVAGLRTMAVGPAKWPEAQAGGWTWLAPVAFPVLFTPELAAAAVSYAADEGATAVIVGLVVGLMLTVAVYVGATNARMVQAVGRFLGAIVIVAAVVAIVSGIRDI